MQYLFYSTSNLNLYDFFIMLYRLEELVATIVADAGGKTLSHISFLYHGDTIVCNGRHICFFWCINMVN